MYIEEYNKPGKDGGDLELSVLSTMLNINIIILKNGFLGYNIYNSYEPNENNKLNNNYIFLNFINDNHFDYLILNEKNPNFDNKQNYINYITNCINKNKIELENIHKKIYPLSLRSSPNIYNEMFDYWNSNCTIITKIRINNSTTFFYY